MQSSKYSNTPIFQYSNTPLISLFPSRPIALSVLGFEVHWYGLLYLAGFLIAAWLLPRIQSHRGLRLSRDEWAGLLTWSVLGVIGGGRLGYVLFYEPAYFLAHPLSIPAVWQGGMSFHGGLIGVVLVLILWSRRNRVPLLALGDVVVVPVAIGLALGRFGNFLNQELYGTVTTLPWAMSFPGAEGLRHPVQLYSMAKDLMIAALCYWHLISAQPRRAAAGQTGALFLILYGIGRFLIEFVREPTSPLVDLGIATITRGQLLTIPVFLFGVVAMVWISSVRKRKN